MQPPSGQGPWAGSPPPQPYTPYPQYPPYGPPPYGPYPPPKKDNTALIIVLVVVAVVVVVILVPILYLLFVPLGGDLVHEPSRPVVLFSGKTKAGIGTWTFTPQPDRAEQMSSYQVLVRNGTTAAVGPVALNTCVASACTGTSGLSIRVTDDVSTGQLTSADLFTLAGTDDTQVSGTYTVVLVYSGSEVGSIRIP